MSNYPDDIHMYDHDHRSPFYQAPVADCVRCGKEFRTDDTEDEDNEYCFDCWEQRLKEDKEDAR